MRKLTLHRRDGIHKAPQPFARALVDNADYTWLKERTWMTDINKSYPYCIKEGTVLQLHVEVMKYHGRYVEGLLVDHKNGDRLDSRKSNLRIATRCENAQNSKRKSTNTTGFKGVSVTRAGKYRSTITAFGIAVPLGTYSTPEEAHVAYCEKGRELHGEFFRGE